MKLLNIIEADLVLLVWTELLECLNAGNLLALILSQTIKKEFEIKA